MERDTIELLKDLVAIDSQNPSLVPGAAGESTIAGYVADWAETAGLAAEIVEATPGRPSVLVRSPGRSARSLLLCGHLPAGTTLLRRQRRLGGLGLSRSRRRLGKPRVIPPRVAVW